MSSSFKKYSQEYNRLSMNQLRVELLSINDEIVGVPTLEQGRRMHIIRKRLTENNVDIPEGLKPNPYVTNPKMLNEHQNEGNKKSGKINPIWHILGAIAIIRLIWKVFGG